MIVAQFTNIEKTILSNIIKCQRNLKIAVAWFTNPTLFDCIKQLNKTGILIELILANDIVNFSNDLIPFQNLIDNKASIHITKPPNLMHNKFCIIDDRLLISGSYNWTLAAEKFNYENVIVCNDLNILNQYIIEFERIKINAEKLIKITSVSFSSYMSDFEKAKEIELLTEVQKCEHPKVETEKKDDQKNPELQALIDKATLLYLKGRHQDSIDFCLKLIEENSNIAELYELIAACKWRQKKYKEQIEFATKAIEIDNLFYSAYNTLGIGYANIGNATKSIENYQICILAEPNDYDCYRNRAVSYRELETDFKIPSSMRNQFAQKANRDLEKVIELTNELEKEESSYRLYYCRGSAYLFLDKIYQAQIDLLKALDLYKASLPLEQDVHELKEIKQYLKDIEKIKNS